MKRADLADAFEWDGSLLNLWSFSTDAPAWLRAMHALDRAFPCAFLIGGEPTPLPDLSEIKTLAEGEEQAAEFHVDTACPGGAGLNRAGALQVFFSLDFGPELMQATLHPLDVPGEAAFVRLTHLVGVLAEATGQDVFLCAESGSFEPRLVYAVYRSASGWSPS